MSSEMPIRSDISRCSLRAVTVRPLQTGFAASEGSLLYVLSACTHPLQPDTHAVIDVQALFTGLEPQSPRKCTVTAVHGKVIADLESLFQRVLSSAVCADVLLGLTPFCSCRCGLITAAKRPATLLDYLPFAWQTRLHCPSDRVRGPVDARIHLVLHLEPATKVVGGLHVPYGNLLLRGSTLTMSLPVGGVVPQQSRTLADAGRG